MRLSSFLKCTYVWGLSGGAGPAFGSGLVGPARGAEAARGGDAKAGDDVRDAAVATILIVH